MICVSRSDTFIREKKQEINTDIDDDTFINTETNYLFHNNLLQSLNEVQISVINIMTKMEHIKKV